MPVKRTSSQRSFTRKRSASGPNSVWRFFQRLQRRDLILLTGLFSLACVSILVVTFLVLRYQPAVQPATPTPVAAVPGPAPTHTVTFVQITGLRQYEPAKTAAQSWAGDAQLVSANATWPKVINKAQVGEPTLWTYRFYSPTRQRMLFVNVAPDGQVQIIEHVAPVSLPPRLISPNNWVIDSPAALSIWLDYGGAKILGSNPGLELLIQLRVLSNDSNPVWVIAGLNSQTENVHTVVIDANRGVVTKLEDGS